MDMLEINYSIQSLRTKLKLSGEEFAKRLSESSGKKYTRSSINNWESGYRIKDEDIVNICKCFNVSADSLLFKGAISFRSDDQRIVDASDYTGLSHKALSLLRHLHEMNYDIEPLNFLLEHISFYRLVIESMKETLRYINVDDTEPDITKEEAAAIDSLYKKGFRLQEPSEAHSTTINMTGNALISMIREIDNRANMPELKGFYERKDSDFIDTILRSIQHKEHSEQKEVEE